MNPGDELQTQSDDIFDAEDSQELNFSQDINQLSNIDPTPPKEIESLNLGDDLQTQRDDPSDIEDSQDVNLSNDITLPKKTESPQDQSSSQQDDYSMNISQGVGSVPFPINQPVPKKKKKKKKHFKIKISGGDGGMTYFKVRGTTKLQKVMDAYLERKGLIQSTVRFMLDGERISMSKSMKDLEIHEGCTIDVVTEQTGGNSWKKWGWVDYSQQNSGSGLDMMDCDD